MISMYRSYYVLRALTDPWLSGGGAHALQLMIVHVSCALQGKFEERWKASVVPKIADEMNTCATEEVAAKRRMIETQRAREVELFERTSSQILSKIEVDPLWHLWQLQPA
eukprot:scaffold157085_cov23-Prasinocladus_malaysianus.AAC.1